MNFLKYSDFEEMKLYIFDVNSGEPYKSIIIRLANFFQIYDLIEGTNHFPVYKMLYLDTKKLRYRKIAEKNHISIETLYKYRKKYLLAIESLIITEDTRQKQV